MKKLYFDSISFERKTGASSFFFQLRPYIQKKYKIVSSFKGCDIVFANGESLSLGTLLAAKLYNKIYIYRVDGKRSSRRHLLLILKYCSGNCNLESSIRMLYDLIKNTMYSAKVHFAVVLADGIIYQSHFIKRDWVFPRILQKIINRQQNQVIIYNASLAVGIDQRINARRHNNGYNLIYAKGVIPSSGFFFESVVDYLYLNDLNNTPSITINLFGSTDHLQENRKLFQKILKLKKNSFILHGHVPREKYLELSSLSSVFICLEDFAPCPNAVIEAYSRCIPAIGPTTGSFPELSISQDLVIDPSRFKSGCLWLHNAIKKASLMEAKIILSHHNVHFGDSQFSKYVDFITFTTN